MTAIKLFLSIIFFLCLGYLAFTEEDAMLSALWSSLAIISGIDAFRINETITPKNNKDGKTYTHQREL